MHRRNSRRARTSHESHDLMPLDPRLALSATLQPDGTLLVLGDAQANNIVIANGGGRGMVRLTGVPGVDDGTVFDDVRTVRVEAGSGNDVVSVSGRPRARGGFLMHFAILGQNGNDTLFGGMRADAIVGGNGADRIFGRGGHDIIKGGNAGDYLVGQRGRDIIDGDNAPDILIGGPHADILRGGNGSDILRGGSGPDILIGGRGEDDLYGGAGDDQLTGGSDRDLLRGPIGEYQDFNDTDAFHSPLIGTNNQNLVGLTDVFWMQVDAQTRDRDLHESAVRALDSLQLIKARAAEERLAFDQAFANLTEQERQNAREQFQGIIDDFLADIRGNPGDLTSLRLLEFQANVRDEFPGEVRDEFDDYMEAMIELDNQVSDLGDAMDDLEDDMLAEPYLAEFARLFEF